MDQPATTEKSDLNEGPDDIERLATPRAARRHRNRRPQSSPHLLYASWVRFIGFHYVTPNGLSTRRAETSIDQGVPEMAQLISGKPMSQA
jgi:hypothetical protein